MRTLSLPEAKMKLSELIEIISSTNEEIVITKKRRPAMNSYKLIVIFVYLVTGFTMLKLGSPAWAFGTELSRSSLEGLQGVVVRTAGKLEPEIEKKGLSLDQIKKDVEAKLQSAGIYLLSDLEFLETKERPLLRVNVNTIKQNTGFIFSVIVQLYQHVYLIKKGQSTTYPATTWSSNGVIGIFYDLEDLRSLVKEETDIFIKAYRSANPK